MTCLCGYEFCYVCDREYSRCRCTYIPDFYANREREREAPPENERRNERRNRRRVRPLSPPRVETPPRVESPPRDPSISNLMYLWESSNSEESREIPRLQSNVVLPSLMSLEKAANPPEHWKSQPLFELPGSPKTSENDSPSEIHE
uniref:Uncharacterized protein n=1 Tax=Euplotes harpa TaxID=151035 RepID=A0A7S3J8S4_9SPIT